MRKWYLSGITSCLVLGASGPSFAREIAADGSLEEARKAQVVSQVSTERTWKELKSKAQNLWTSYFGDQEKTDRETVKKPSKAEDSNLKRPIADSSSQASSAQVPNAQAPSQALRLRMSPQLRLQIISPLLRKPPTTFQNIKFKIRESLVRRSNRLSKKFKKTIR
ncbi:MAG: hypothetical protein IPL83_20190 [Bdellovibrionales bacterium]|nr:hypothetical protein [Bdellovibrionales bacterium]